MESSTFYMALLVLFVVAIFFGRITKWLVASSLYKRYYSALQSSWSKYPQPAERIREKLVALLIGKLCEDGGDVLEIGVSVGRNLKYMDLPEGSSYIAVDYNPEMESYLRENLKRFPEKNIPLKQFIAEDAGNMKTVPDNSVTAVLTTQILCSLEEEEVRKVLSEVKRVLKPGGYYLFMEHVIDTPWTTRRFLQNLACMGGLMPLLIDGCRCNKETWKYILDTGFQKVTYEKCYNPQSYFWSCPILSYLHYLTRVKIHGYAVKR